MVRKTQLHDLIYFILLIVPIERITMSRWFFRIRWMEKKNLSTIYMMWCFIKIIISSNNVSIMVKFKTFMNRRSYNLHGRNPYNNKTNLEFIRSRNESKVSKKGFP